MGSGMIRSLSQAAQAVGGTLIGPDAPLEGPVVTDSRQAAPGSLFVAVAGERTDGHAHLASAAALGAVGALVSDLDAARQGLAGQDSPDSQDSRGGDEPPLGLILVSDTVEALGALARTHLARLRAAARDRGSDLSVVAMTGSVGKTTTKDLTRQLLAAAGPTVAPRASFNNEIGLPLTVLEADESTRYLVLEMGASGPGHIAYLTDIAPLDAAAILMIGHAHMGGFGSIEGVAQAKAEILDGLEPHGTALLNADDPRTAALADRAPGEVLTFSRQGPADIRAQGVELGQGARASFDLILPGLEGPRRLTLAVAGEHNVSNALAAAGLALAAGVPADLIAEQLAAVSIESPHRMDIQTLGGDLLLIDDSYNANIDSMTAALAALPDLAAQRRRVVVVSEMLELGESSQADHRRTGELAHQAGAALLIGIGEGTAPALKAAGALGTRTLAFPDAATAIDQIGTLLQDGDAVLVKGSNGSGAWRLADHLKEARPR
ncbi:UDP-N-acetylmuramoyl-tripeptide--D-alanyl-D-alanine ligase [Actinomyces bowdenii]|uniref:UDP-N-acetylmuramoyl-tripeptide--D-alanyl-D-alanine ligase n=1 Tax=Actinomyces bowdenii TaxID=131109 RepID=A0A853EHG2_9ACTO|nr:UDP-N-acetylmuramoyl-tripeptide--D-alanyl-D-alanine ligase [Actinomyces bowdenii]MBF0696654.1 UDP-N-acetylmuramoyl-tripeptide--D-alanyl-D-alanine ligase [Actinomyces bowdenii]NYS68827.1 UDP-N-acetylmuramoyl-tripeptide--D-alanyl-D-alanine ligase [Actinomyces bowdenii]